MLRFWHSSTTMFPFEILEITLIFYICITSFSYEDKDSLMCSLIASKSFKEEKKTRNKVAYLCCFDNDP